MRRFKVEIVIGRAGDGSVPGPPSSPAPRPASGEPSQFERDAVWLDHLRWGLDHLQHRQELAGQLAFGVLAVQGVFLTLLGTLIGSGSEVQAITFAAALLANAVGVVFSLQAVLPKESKTINIDAFKDFWNAEMARGTGVRAAAMFAEQMMRNKTGNVSIHGHLRGVLDERYSKLRRAILWTGLGVGFVVFAQVYAAAIQFWSFKGA
ncbi:hypothetical protein JN535_08595 [Cellulosimicrobium cellulans]|uniref:hypothetical protein n=1 Tax=Cellulosimicrobium cellulans TaxID=1710 RepID=UPI001965AFB4|nr:hypothetical protein [Cellulosimicrobium cellulans]MBN0040224.1 hypothetical protein [Cellulosimicrobium cellulans]